MFLLEKKIKGSVDFFLIVYLKFEYISELNRLGIFGFGDLEKFLKVLIEEVIKCIKDYLV